jgi:Cu2+-containing amine oxidase
MIAAVVGILALLVTCVHAAVPPTHALDPLSQHELTATVAVLRTGGHIDKNTRFVFLSLRSLSSTMCSRGNRETASRARHSSSSSRAARPTKRSLIYRRISLNAGAKSKAFSPPC